VTCPKDIFWKKGPKSPYFEGKKKSFLAIFRAWVVVYRRV
jgi:hypothetical protein